MNWLLAIIPAYRRLLHETDNLTSLLEEEQRNRLAAEDLRNLWQSRYENAMEDYRREVASHQQDLRDTVDAMTRRFLLQNMFSKAPAAAPQSAAPPQVYRPNERKPAREVIAEKKIDLQNDLEEYLKKSATQ